MAKINILPAQVYNRIAAGEVVDRPYSVVKELVENAIDAGATEIEIYIEKGGKQLVRVVDNGGGIGKDDLKSAFLPHATSKIEKADDLNCILTLGFRGEAVASIAAVSKMTITSKVAGENCYSLTCDGGDLGEITETAGDDGTDVKAEMLFFNTPVRQKFMKSDKAEEAEITDFVSRFILNRPQVAFRYYADGKKILQSFGGGEEEAFAGVYGASVLKECYHIDAVKHGVRIRGYIGNQNFFKPNKSYQNVFLNGRYITNVTISAAISGAYSTYLMKRQYPFCVLYIDVPPEIVDVNVHPNKADVRFANNQIIYGCIYTVLAAVLDGNSKALEYIVPENGKQSVEKSESGAGMKTSAETEKSKSASARSEAQSEPKRDRASGFTYEEAKKEVEKDVPLFTVNMVKKGADPFELPFKVEEETEREKADRAKGVTTIFDLYREDEAERGKKKKPPKVEEEYANLYFAKNELRVNNSTPSVVPAEAVPPVAPIAPEGVPERESVSQSEDNSDFFAENKRYLEEAERKAKQNRIDISTCVYAGKIFNTYLMYERGEELYIIDQHAAHERLIFNRLKKRMENREVLQQPMLLPYKLDLNAFECNFIRENIENIRAMGFDIEEFGSNSFKISAVPLDLQSIDLGVFFNDILGNINSYRAIKLEDLLKDKLATAACKAAVKGGMDLTRAEVDELFRLMDGDMGLKCPHGRPVVVKMSKTEIEKMFKRIV